MANGFTYRLARLKGSGHSGQAAIELVVSILLLLIVVTGLIQVNRMARTSLFLHSVLRGRVGETAMESSSVSVTPEYISDWQAGADGERYTADDKPVTGGASLPTLLGNLVSDSVRTPEDWGYIADASQLPVSMVQLYKSPSMAATLGFAHEAETLDVPVDPVLRQLVYGKDEVTIKEEVWMPLMGGLY